MPKVRIANGGPPFVRLSSGDLVFYAADDVIAPNDAVTAALVAAGKLLVVDANVHSSPLRPSPRVPRILSAKFFGHSYVAGSGASKRDLAFPARVASMLGAREENSGQAGSQWALKFNSAALLLQAIAPPSVAPYQPASQLVVICTGINDLNTQVLINGGLKHFERTMRAAIMRARAERKHEAETDASWAFSAGANSLQVSQNSGTGYRRLTANGQTWTITTPADFPGGELQVHGVRFDAWGALTAITVDGAAAGVWDTKTDPDVALFTPTLFKLTGLTPGAHTIVGTVGSINTGNFETLDYWQVPSRDPGLVVVCNVARVPVYPTGGTHTATDADVAALNAIINSVAGEFDDRVVVADIDSVLGKNAANFASDGLHPNDVGHGLVAEVVYGAVDAHRPSAGTLSKAQVPAGDVITTPRVLEGTNAAMGVATLVAGMVVVNDSRVSASTRIFLQGQDSNGAHGELTISARVAGTSFTITSSSATDVRQVAYLLVEPA